MSCVDGAYVDGVVVAVPTANKDAYKALARQHWAILSRLGALATWDCWGDDVPDGTTTSFPMAVQCREDETVVLSWVVWPDKATREAAWAVMTSDPEIAGVKSDMPFDTGRMIVGGFDALVSLGVHPAGVS